MTAVTLSHDQLQELATMIADELRGGGGARLADAATLGQPVGQATYEGELIDAAELARRLGKSRGFVYEHAGALGAIRLGAVGDGRRPRLFFRWPLDRGTLSGQVGSAEPIVPVGGGSAVRRRRRLGTTPVLLPVRGVDGGSR